MTCSRRRPALAFLLLVLLGGAGARATAGPDELQPDELNAEMRAWVAAHTRASDPPEERLIELLAALQSSEELGLKYEASHTGTAQEVFASGRFNCLSFTMLFVGMARELGIDAYYLRVADIERYTKEGDLVVVSGHVTAGYGSGPQRRVLEFRIGPPVDYRDAQPVSDLQARAMYYSNRGAELLRAGDTGPAVESLERATALDPSFVEAWVNLGVARRRSADLAGAEKAYRRAIDLDSGSLSAYHNLAALMRLRGDRDASREMLALLDRRDNRDPFMYLALGDSSLEVGRLDEARRFYRRALRLADRDDAEARAAMGLLELAAGNRLEATRWLAKARERDPTRPRVLRLEQLLTAGSTPPTGELQ